MLAHLKKAESHPGVAKSFGRQRIITLFPSVWFVFGAQPGEIVAHFLRGHIANVTIADVCHPLLEVALVTLDGGGRESSRRFVLDEARNRFRKL